MAGEAQVCDYSAVPGAQQLLKISEEACRVQQRVRYPTSNHVRCLQHPSTQHIMMRGEKQHRGTTTETLSSEFDSKWLPSIGTMRHLCLLCWSEGLSEKGLALVCNTPHAHLLEPPHSALFTKHRRTLKVQLERSCAFMQSVASYVGNLGRSYITLLVLDKMGTTV